MATGSFFNSLGFKLYVKLGTTSSTNPTATTGMTEVLSLSNAGIQGSSQTQEVQDYGSTLGYTASSVLSILKRNPCLFLRFLLLG